MSSYQVYKNLIRNAGSVLKAMKILDHAANNKRIDLYDFENLLNFTSLHYHTEEVYFL